MKKEGDKITFIVPVYLNTDFKTTKTAKIRKDTGMYRTTLSLNAVMGLHRFTYSKVKKAFFNYIEEQLVGIDPIEYDLIKVDLNFYYKNPTSDMDNFISVINKFTLDSLQKLGIIKNDNISYIKQINATVGGQDKLNPRIEFTLSEYNNI